MEALLILAFYVESRACVVVNLVAAVQLHPDGAVVAFPAVLALARPLPLVALAEAAAAAGDAASVAGALPGAALESAVEAVPAGDAEAGAVLALRKNTVFLSECYPIAST